MGEAVKMGHSRRIHSSPPKDGHHVWRSPGPSCGSGLELTATRSDTPPGSFLCFDFGSASTLLLKGCAGLGYPMSATSDLATLRTLVPHSTTIYFIIFSPMSYQVCFKICLPAVFPCVSVHQVERKRNRQAVMITRYQPLSY